MKIIETALPGCLLLSQTQYRDQRGYFQELYVQQRYEEALGLTEPLVQDNLSHSSRGVIRGMHFQRQQPQGKLITVLQGCIYDVMVDIRPNSPTYGQWQGIILSADNPQRLWIPAGFAHGFQALDSTNLVFYKTSRYYNPKDEGAISAFDPELKISWPLEKTAISTKDLQAPNFAEIKAML